MDVLNVVSLSRSFELRKVTMTAERTIGQKKGPSVFLDRSDVFTVLILQGHRDLKMVFLLFWPV